MLGIGKYAKLGLSFLVAAGCASEPKDDLIKLIEQAERSGKINEVYHQTDNAKSASQESYVPKQNEEKRSQYDDLFSGYALNLANVESAKPIILPREQDRFLVDWLLPDEISINLQALKPSMNGKGFLPNKEGILNYGSIEEINPYNGLGSICILPFLDFGYKLPDDKTTINFGFHEGSLHTSTWSKEINGLIPAHTHVDAGVIAPYIGLSGFCRPLSEEGVNIGGIARVHLAHADLTQGVRFPFVKDYHNEGTGLGYSVGPVLRIPLSEGLFRDLFGDLLKNTEMGIGILYQNANVGFAKENEPSPTLSIIKEYR